MKRIAIVGGGISGLAVAFYLEKLTRGTRSQDSVQIELFEGSSRLGGKIFTEKVDGLTLEMGAESFLARKPAGMQFCQDLEVDSQLRSTNPDTRKTFIWQGGTMHRLPEGLSGFIPANLKSLKSTTLLSWMGKLRVAGDLLLPARKSDDDESVASFISRRIGRQAYERIAEPLLCGIYCASGDELSLAATFPHLRELERNHGSLLKGFKSQKQKTAGAKTPSQFASPFATFAGGMSDLIEAAAGALTQTQVHFNTPIESIEQNGAQWNVNFSGGSNAAFDQIVLTVPAFHAAKFVRGVDAPLSNSLLKIPHASTALVNIWYDAKTMGHDLDGYGFVIPAKEQRTMTAVTWTSSKHFDRSPDGVKLIRAYLGKSGSEITAEQDDQELLDISFRELKRTMGFDATPIDFRIQRWQMGSPQYTMQHLQTMSEIDTRIAELDGLYLCGASYRGVGIPDCIGAGKSLAEEIVEALKLASD